MRVSWTQQAFAVGGKSSDDFTTYERAKLTPLNPQPLHNVAASSVENGWWWKRSHGVRITLCDVTGPYSDREGAHSRGVGPSDVLAACCGSGARVSGSKPRECGKRLTRFLLINWNKMHYGVADTYMLGNYTILCFIFHVETVGTTSRVAAGYKTNIVTGHPNVIGNK